MFKNNDFYNAKVGESEDLNKDTSTQDKPTKKDNDSDKHYELWDGFEAIDIMRITLTNNEFIGFLKGSILKYQLRLGKKDNVESEKRKIAYYQKLLNELLRVD
jgi:hypothetical protein